MVPFPPVTPKDGMFFSICIQNGMRWCSNNIDDVQRKSNPLLGLLEGRLSAKKCRLYAEAPHQDDTIKPLLEPSNGIVLLYSVLEANTSPPSLPPGHTSSRSTHHHVEVHTENTDTWVIPSTEIDVFLDTESKVSGLREVSLSEFVLLDLEATLEDFLSLGAADGNVDGDLFVTTDTKRSDGIAGFRCHGCLTGELFQHLGSPCQSVARFTNGYVCTAAEFLQSQQRKQRTDNELFNPKLLHRVCWDSFLFGLHDE